MFNIKIGEAEKITGLTSKSIRLYESKKLLNVTRSGNSYREYTDENIELLKKIKLLRELGIAIADIKLWCDGVIDINVLIKKRRRELDELYKQNSSQKELCNAILNNELKMSNVETSFSDPDLKLTADTDSESDPLSLGIDIGTTSISAQLVDIKTGRSVHTYTFDHNAMLTLPNCPDAYAEDAELLLNCALNLIYSVTDVYRNVKSIGITGQMHGIVCLDKNNGILSPLYTWENKFGTRKENGCTICENIREITGESVPTGYGFVTLYALKKLGLLPAGTSKVCTIADLAAAELCKNKQIIVHPTNAAALGFYDICSADFKCDKLEKLGIGNDFVPRVVSDYEVIGHYGNIPVSAAIGDNQAGFYGSINNERQMLLNVGTSGQISILTDKSRSSVGEIRPYFDGKYLLSGSMLCGGKAYAALAEFYRSVASMLGLDLTKNEVYSLMNTQFDEPVSNPFEISVNFSGTRENDSVRGYIKNIGLDNFNAKSLTQGIVNGIIGELYAMYKKIDPEAHVSADQAVVSGNAMRKNAALRSKAADLFGFEMLVPIHNEEAAYGAALYSAVSSEIITRDERCKLIRYE